MRRLEKAFQAFFRGDGERPRFKGNIEFGSFAYPQAYNGSVKLDAGRKRIFFSKIGNVRIVPHRQVPIGLLLKMCTVKREPDGKWYACLTYDLGEAPAGEEEIPASKSPVGIDLGLKSLITTSDGVKIEHPRFLRRSEEKIGRFQRGISNKQKGSKNRKRMRRKLAVLHSKVSHQRTDFCHKLSSKLVERHDLLVFEDLNVGNLMMNHLLGEVNC